MTDDDEVLNRKQAAKAAGISTSTLDRLRVLKAFPAPQQLSKRRIAWLRRAVRTWVAERPSAGR